jgi:hypothetical protein
MSANKGGRKPGYKHTDIVRNRIRVGYYMSRMHKCIKGEIELTPAQLKCIEILLKKALPDLSAVEYTGAVEHSHVQDLTDAEISARLAEIRSRIASGDAAADAGADEPSPVHRIYNS